MFLIGAKYRNLLSESLSKLGVDVLWLPDNPNVDDRLSGHADLMIYASGKSIVLSQNLYRLYNSYFISNHTDYNVSIASHFQGAEYPDDCRLCVCSTGRYDIYNPRVIDPAVKCSLSGIPVTVNQGYTACSVCVVNEHTIITSDSAIAAAAESVGMNVLQVQPGSIQLDGFDYGFIGGASFLLSAGRIAFTGVLDDHPDKGRILQFLAANDVEPVYLTKMSLFDIGGAVSLP